MTSVLKILPSAYDLGQFFTIRTSQPASNLHLFLVVKFAYTYKTLPHGDGMFQHNFSLISDQLLLSLQNIRPLLVGVDCWALRVEILSFHLVGLISQLV